VSLNIMAPLTIKTDVHGNLKSFLSLYTSHKQG